MDANAKLEWFSHKRIMKLYPGEKARFGSRRLLVIGIGANGADILIKCKDIAESRYACDKSHIRFLGIGLKERLDVSENGSVLNEDERLEIDPEEAVYPYLNDPEKIPEAAKAWFDEGLRNYTPAKPTYGLNKRQCARMALFHYFDKILKLFGDIINGFSNEQKPVEIVFTGNLGDAFFGGMMIDLAYIAKGMFNSLGCPVTVNAYMLAADTALLQGLDGRDLAIFYANTIVAKAELDRFQFQKRKYSQKFAENYTFSSDKPPFQSCVVNAAEDTYEATVDNIALKIVADCAPVFKSDDDAERLLSYNMLGNAENHSFRYICGSIAVDEAPVGKLTSYLALKMVVMTYNHLLKKSAGEMELGIIGRKVVPSDLIIAAKSGDLPKFEYDENLNPLFSLKSLKNGAEASKKYVGERVEIIADMCRQGASIYIDEVYDQIHGICEDARLDNEKGPFYAAEIVRRCLSELKNAIAAAKDAIDGADVSVSREEKLLAGEQHNIRGTLGLFGAKSAEAYIDRIKQYADALRAKLTGGIMLELYRDLYNRLNDYYTDDLSRLTGLFSAAIDRFHSISDEMKPSENDRFLHDAFDASGENVVSLLSKLADELPESTTAHLFKRCGLLKAADSDDERGFAAEAAAMTAMCFNDVLNGGYEGLCGLFGTENDVSAALEGCLGRVRVTTPAAEEDPLVRIICPRDVKNGDIAGLKAAHSGLAYVWNKSPLPATVMVQRIMGNVALDKFKDYKQWENMRYAYVNDSLKKHGIHIFN